MIQKFEDYMKNEKGLSDNTVYNYILDLNKFQNFCGKKFSEVERSDIESYIAHLKSIGMVSTTVYRKIASLKSFYKFLMRKNYVRENPTLLIEGGKIERKLPRPIAVEDINKISNNAESLRDKAIIETLYGSGLRRMEIVTLKKSDVNWNKGILHIKGKGKKERLVPLNGYALSLLKMYSDSHNSEWVFPSIKGGHLSTRRLNEIISHEASKAHMKGITPHMFRHSFGTHLYEKGIDSKVLQDLMGHESINTTSIYAKVSIERNLSEYNKYFNRGQNTETANV